MYCILQGHNYVYEVQTITQVFFPNERFLQINEIPADKFAVLSRLENLRITAEIYNCGVLTNSSVLEITDAEYSNPQEQTALIRHNIKTSLYNALIKETGRIPEWGIFTGIRPSKLVRELKIDNPQFTPNEISAFLHEKYKMNFDKISLCAEVAEAEDKILQGNNGNDIGLYIGIPFCPTRCLYCSFTSNKLEHTGCADEYLSALAKELKFIGKLSAKRYLETIYIGGGTPTALSEYQLEHLLERVSGNFDVTNTKEFTVEAGRADTISEAKLRVLKKYGVSRISINPQTMNDETLVRIGRKHSVTDFLYAFDKARMLGFDNINTDIIVGLPGESCSEVEKTMDELRKLSPESITVHTLSIKRASILKENIETAFLTEAAEMEKMIGIARGGAKDMGMKPYYMYRQKNSLGNFENVGYCKRNCECIYNVQIMEERQTILGAGAGSTTKTVEFKAGGETKIERIFNVKNYKEYITRIDEMIERKRYLDADTNT